jgi:hypothetical protein
MTTETMGEIGDGVERASEREKRVELYLGTRRIKTMATVKRYKKQSLGQGR